MSTCIEETPTNRVKPVNAIVPRVNLRQDGDGYTLEAEMPGVPREGVELSVEDGKLVLVGHRKAPDVGGRLVYRESTGDTFRRAFDLDPAIDPDKISARFEAGLVVIRLPKAESSKPRTIAIE